MASQRKSPAIGGASEILLRGSFRDTYSTQNSKRQALELIEDTFRRAYQRAMANPSCENILLAESAKAAFKGAWGQLC